MAEMEKAASKKERRSQGRMRLKYLKERQEITKIESSTLGHKAGRR
jgi:hypothetical protein